MYPKKFYIIGSQRSGTTLLRLILNSHSKIICHDEKKAYDVLADNQKLDSILNKETEKQWIGFKIPRFTELLNNSSIFDYYSLSPHTFPNFYKKDPLFFIIRDVRDVVCSMINLRFGENSWLQNRVIPLTKFWIEKSEEFRKEYDYEIALVNKATNYELAMGALYWKFKSKCYFRYIQLKFPIIKIKYEDLVQNPKKNIALLINHLNLDWEDSLLQHHRIEHSETDEKGFAVGSTDSHIPISNFHLERYKNELTKNQLDEILSISGDLMESFGYSI